MSSGFVVMKLRVRIQIPTAIFNVEKYKLRHKIFATRCLQEQSVTACITNQSFGARNLFHKSNLTDHSSIGALPNEK